jgi:hypothetical protein
VHHGTEPARPFAGWLELVALLEAERAATKPPNAAADSP